MNEIKNRINGLELGNAQQYKNMAVLPLIGKSSNLDYLVFSDALNSGLSVRETGDVSTLHFTNKTGNEVLILQGEYVMGGKQNRMVATNVCMSKNFDGPVPVRCVEHFRWQGDVGTRFRSVDTIATKKVAFAAAIGQQEVWDEVADLAQEHCVSAPTFDMGEVFQQKKSDTGEYSSRFNYINGSVGVVALINSGSRKIVGVDIFDKARTMEKHFNKIIQSYSLDAIHQGNNAEVNERRIADFIDNIENCSFVERKAVSLGRDYKIEGDKIECFALVYDDNALYTTFTNRSETGKIRRASNTLETLEAHTGYSTCTGFRRIR